MQVPVAHTRRSPSPPPPSERRAVENFKFRATQRNMMFCPNKGANGMPGIIKNKDWPPFRIRNAAVDKLPRRAKSDARGLYDHVQSSELQAICWVGADIATVRTWLPIAAIPRLLIERGWFSSERCIEAKLTVDGSAMSVEPTSTSALVGLVDKFRAAGVASEVTIKSEPDAEDELNPGERVALQTGEVGTLLTREYGFHRVLVDGESSHRNLRKHHLRRLVSSADLSPPKKPQAKAAVGARVSMKFVGRSNRVHGTITGSSALCDYAYVQLDGKETILAFKVSELGIEATKTPAGTNAPPTKKIKVKHERELAAEDARTEKQAPVKKYGKKKPAETQALDKKYGKKKLAVEDALTETQAPVKFKVKVEYNRKCGVKCATMLSSSPEMHAPPKARLSRKDPGEKERRAKLKAGQRVYTTIDGETKHGTIQRMDRGGSRFVLFDGDDEPRRVLPSDLQIATTIDITQAPQAGEMCDATAQDVKLRVDLVVGARVEVTQPESITLRGMIVERSAGFYDVSCDGESNPRKCRAEALRVLNHHQDEVSPPALKRRTSSIPSANETTKRATTRRAKTKCLARLGDMVDCHDGLVVGCKVLAKWLEEDSLEAASPAKVTAVYVDEKSFDLEFDDGAYWERAPARMIVEHL